MMKVYSLDAYLQICSYNAYYSDRCHACLCTCMSAWLLDSSKLGTTAVMKSVQCLIFARDMIRKLELWKSLRSMYTMPYSNYLVEFGGFMDTGMQKKNFECVFEQAILLFLPYTSRSIFANKVMLTARPIQILGLQSAYFIFTW